MRVFEANPQDTALLLRIEVPAFGLSANASFRLELSSRSDGETCTLDLLDSIIDSLREEHKLSVDETELPGSEATFQQMRRDASQALADWQQRLDAAKTGIRALEEANIKVKNAKSQMNSMRDSYFKELLLLREQVYRKQEAEKANQNFKPDVVAIFDPCEYNFEDEVGKVIKQKAALLEEKFEQAYAEKMQRHQSHTSALNSKLTSLRMMLDRKDQLLRGLMSKHDYQTEQALERSIASELLDVPDVPGVELPSSSHTSRTGSKKSAEVAALKKSMSGSTSLGSVEKKTSASSIGRSYGAGPILASAARSLNRLRSRQKVDSSLNGSGSSSECAKSPRSARSPQPRKFSKLTVSSVMNAMFKRTNKRDVPADSLGKQPNAALTLLDAEQRPSKSFFKRSLTSPSQGLARIVPSPVSLSSDAIVKPCAELDESKDLGKPLMCTRAVQSDVSGTLVERALKALEHENLHNSDQRWLSLLQGNEYEEETEKNEEPAKKESKRLGLEPIVEHVLAPTKTFKTAAVQVSPTVEDLQVQCNAEDDEFANGLIELAQEQIHLAIESGDPASLRNAIQLASDAGLRQELIRRGEMALEEAERKLAIRNALQGRHKVGEFSRAVSDGSESVITPTSPSSQVSLMHLDTEHREERTNYKGTLVRKRRSSR
eukprot:TRINITY_DN74478_c0_g1_i1.p1 TRINITY_DN74478_c0_g1~~TRINITY_DN74478_c0_g1_i1.p1  ORF type:complete len:661 (+),score=120.55 TRINITY_DN74478_c0_g1_i1:96-2078(+)